MHTNLLKPRYWLAITLGVGSAIVLSTLLLDGKTGHLIDREEAPPVIVTTGTVQSGQILAKILSNHKLPDPYIFRIQKTLAKSFNLRRMRPGDNYALITSTMGVFKEFIYETDPIHAFSVTRSSMGVYACEKTSRKTVWLEKKVSCTVTESLYKDLLKKGYSERFVANLVTSLADHIFAWRIDFFTEQRPGDQVEVLMEQEYRVGSSKPLWGGGGRILAASYVGTGTKEKENIAIRYQAPGNKTHDYFNIEGKAVRKAFRRSPFSHSGFRISSPFNPRRFHPILRRYRPHHGTDYACRTGTPVVSIGKGKVVRASWNGGYGKCVDIKHSSKYMSRYGHLSRINIKKGQTVEEGQYIGKSGSTGRSTGPHLHFEIHVDGKPRNFLRLNFPAAKSVTAQNMQEFNKVRDVVMERLHQTPEVALLPTS